MTFRRRLAHLALGPLTLLAIPLLAGCPREPARPAAAPAPSAQPAAVHSAVTVPTALTPVGVTAFMRAVGSKVAGPRLVRGVVSAVSAEHHTFALTDASQGGYVCTGFDCQSGCCSLSLPVRWKGPLPRVNQTVLVTGTVETTGGKLVFVASRLERPGTNP